MKSYVIEDFQNKDSYIRFIRFMLAKSDTFSLVYFKYFEGEKVKKSTKEIRNLLKKNKIFSINGNQWPCTVTLNENNHIYNIVLYKSDSNAELALTKVTKLFDWDYPLFPMDLCFYKDGYAWFKSCAHEHFAFLYTDDIKCIEELKNLGAQVQNDGIIHNSKLFLEKSLKIVIKNFSEANQI